MLVRIQLSPREPRCLCRLHRRWGGRGLQGAHHTGAPVISSSTGLSSLQPGPAPPSAETEGPTRPPASLPMRAVPAADTWAERSGLHRDAAVRLG